MLPVVPRGVQTQAQKQAPFKRRRRRLKQKHTKLPENVHKPATSRRNSFVEFPRSQLWNWEHKEKNSARKSQPRPAKRKLLIDQLPRLAKPTPPAPIVAPPKQPRYVSSRYRSDSDSSQTDRLLLQTSIEDDPFHKPDVDRLNKSNDVEAYYSESTRLSLFSQYQHMDMFPTRGSTDDSPRCKYLRHCYSKGLGPLPLLDFSHTFTGSSNSMQTIDLSHKQLGTSKNTRLTGLLPFFEQCPFRVGILKLSDNALDDKALSLLFGALENGLLNDLQELDLSCNSISASGCQCLAEYLSTTICLTTVNLGSNTFGTDGTAQVLRSLLRNTSVKAISLRNNGMIGIAPQQIKSQTHISELMMKTKTLTKLDLSWNNLSKTHAARIGHALAINSTITALNIAHNGFGDRQATDKLTTSLCGNRGLTHLDISHNQLTERAALLFMDTLSKNSKLAQLNLDGNPIGPLGCRAIVKHIGLSTAAAGDDDAGVSTLITVSDCNFEMTDNTIFDELHPNGEYSLDLSDTYDNYVAEQLIRLAVEQGGECWFGEAINGKPFQLNENATISDIPYLLPPDGILTLTFRSQKDRAQGHMTAKQLTRIKQCFGDQSNTAAAFGVEVRQKDSQSADEWLSRDSSNVPYNQTSLSSASRGVLAEAMSALYTFDASDVMSFIDNFGHDRSAKVHAAAQLYTRVVRSEQISQLLSQLTALEKMQLRNILGSYWAFNPVNPTGHYSLNLAVEIDRQLAQSIFETNNRERLRRIAEGKPDLSQNQNREQIRNARYNDVDFVYRTGYQLPPHGKLEFDYCSSERPPADAEAVDEMNFSIFVGQYVTLSDSKPLNDAQALEAKVAFQEMDADGSGSIQTAEMMEYLQNLNSGASATGGGGDARPKKERRRRGSQCLRDLKGASMPSRERIEEMIHEADTDGTGEVEWREFLGLWAAIHHHVHIVELRQHFNQFDKDGSGSVDTAELRFLLNSIGLHPSDESLQEMIAKADEDGTSEIEFAEFLGLWAAVLRDYRAANLVIELRRQSTKYYFTASQVRRILVNIKYQEDRIQAFLALYARIVDEENFHTALEPLVSSSRKQVNHQLGVLACFNPLAPDAWYSLNLAQHDCWICARVLTDLADIEPGENWFGETYEGKEFDFSEMWIKETPRKGLLELRYGCAKGNEEMAYRREKCEQVLGWEFDAFDEEEELKKARHNAWAMKKQAEEEKQALLKALAQKKKTMQSA